MALKLSLVLRHARLNIIETTIGPSAILKIRTGAPPASGDAADTGSVLSTFTLPVDWLADGLAGTILKAGTWQDTSADASGEAAHFRIYASDGVTPHIQGTVTATGLGGDMTLDNVSIASAQNITITSFTLTEGNA